MPSLHFASLLKKKRTKNNSQDTSEASSQSNSSLTPATAASPAPAPAPASGPIPVSSPAAHTNVSEVNLSNYQRPPQQQLPAEKEFDAKPRAGMHPVTVHPQNYPHQGQHVTAAQGPTPSEPQQGLPTINNLIHQPQAQHDAQSMFPNSHLATPPHNTPPSASPGTDPERLLREQQQQQQQQQQAMMNQPQQAQDGQLQHQQQQQNQQNQQAVQSQRPYHLSHQSQPSVSRQTKGKYSLLDFDLLRTLGTGSFGRVHLVQSKHNQRFYAIKVLKKAQVVSMKQVEHTNDERRMLGEVKHPFLITLWGTFQDAKNLYMVMDFVEGGELFSLLRKSGRFPNPVAKFYAAEVTLALEYLHSKDIIYRDLKPENLLLDRHGHLKITDFGFAKKVPDKTWTLCGTPDYLAPEVVSNKGYNKSVDWWSLGILVYEMLCGYTPFWDSGSQMKIYEKILRGKVKYPQYMDPTARDLLEKLITPDLTKRLGNLYNGPADVKNHPWFAEVTWERLARKDIDAPYSPPVKGGTGDASQFDRYPEETEKYGATGHDEYGHLFTEF